MAKLDKRFEATLLKSPAGGGWTYVVMPDSVEYFGTRGLVKVRGTIDGEPFRSCAGSCHRSLIAARLAERYAVARLRP